MKIIVSAPAALLAAMFTSGCMEQSSPEVTGSTPSLNDKQEEVVGSIDSILIDGQTGTSKIVFTHLGDGKGLVDGDMIINIPGTPRVAARGTAAGLTNLVSRWPLGRVPYVISSAFSATEVATIRSGMALVQNQASVSFFGRTTETDFIEIIKSTGNSSALGRTGGRQTLRLAADQSAGTAAHELLHALGFFHEQSRSDRGNAIQIVWSNIIDAKEHNFRTYIQDGFAGRDYGTFDFESIMLYPSVISDPTFAVNTSLPVMTRLDGSSWTSQSSNLSTGDANALRDMYGWKGSWPSWGDRYLVGDFNGDQISDLFLTGTGGNWAGYKVFSSNRSGFAQAMSGSWPSSSDRISIGDFNGDKVSDILVQAGNSAWGGYQVHLSNKSSFTTGWTGSWPSYGDKVTTGDFNGDGKSDLFIQSIGSGWGGYKVYLSTGTGFALGWQGSWPSYADRVVVGDFTADGKADLLITADRGAGATWGGWTLHSSSGSSFSALKSGSWPSWGEQIAVGDVISGGSPEIVVWANPSYTTWGGSKVMSWNGSNFVESFSTHWPSNGEQIHIGNFNGREGADLLVAGTPSNQSLSGYLIYNYAVR